jgi:glycogen synthase
VSRPVLEALAVAGVDRVRLVELPAFLPAAVRPGELSESVREAREKHGMLLSAAIAPSPVYGARVLWAALLQLRRTRPELGILVFGPGSDALAGELEKAGVREFVYGLGELSHADALAAMAVSDVFVRPTLADGDAISVREALALGVRTVASDVASRPAGTHIFTAGDPYALAEAVERALQSDPPAIASADALPELAKIYRDMSGPRRIEVRFRSARRRQLGFAPGF